MKAGSKKIFIDIANEVGSLVQQKNEAYGDSFAKSQDIVKILFPEGVEPHQYRDMLAVTRVIDKLFRIATNKDAFGESPWRDICGYAILGIANDEGDKRERQKQEKEEAKAKQEEQEEPRVNTVKVIPPEVVRELVIQRVRDRKDEGHGNPYANIDDGDDDNDNEDKAPVGNNHNKRDARLSYDNSKDNKAKEPELILEYPNLNEILVRLEKEKAEGNKEKDAQNLEHWGNAVADAGNIPSE